MLEEQGHTRDSEMGDAIPAALSTENISSTNNAEAGRDGVKSGLTQTSEAANVGEAAGDNADIEGDSEAETLIQSPEKKRNIVDSAPSLLPSHTASASINISNAPAEEVNSRKRKRSTNEGRPDLHSPAPSRRSSPLSSPVAHAHSSSSDSERSTKRRTRKNDHELPKHNGARDESSESENSVSRKRRPSDTVRQHKRDRHSIDVGERRETRSATYPRPSDDERSPSPRLVNRREHKRGVSTQLTAHEFERKKRGRPPLINTRRHRSVERTRSPDSDDDSPAPPRSGLHKFSSIDHDTMSPAKTGPRKWRDKNGRTWVARAANNDDLEGVKSKLAERPEDLNLADNAGNSPLQIAALEGFVDIVEYLLEQGCEVDSRNIDKDTPLIDAVENGHVEVVKLLLAYGANPRLGNAKGDEPYELVHQDDKNYGEIRRLLAKAKENSSGQPRPLDTTNTKDPDGGSSSHPASAASPRDSPPAGPRSPPAIASRRRTGRSESTRNDLLWQANTPENLTKLAGRGDTQGVASILNILQKAGTESLIAAAKAGHEEVLQYLLGMGDPDPDPEPVRSLNPGYNTPLLAAIGRGHVDVVKLLVNQSGFNPTKKFAGKTYYDIAEERKGQDWKQERSILQAAYDRYMTTKGRKQGSPRKTRDVDKVKARPPRQSSSPVPQKQSSSSPALTHKSLPSKSTDSSPKERRKAESLDKRKPVPNRPEVTDTTSIAVSSDHDQTVKTVKKGHRVRRSQSDLPAPKILDSDAPYRRRRLVTGKEHRRNKSSAPGSSTSSGEETADMIEVKQEDKQAPSLKRSRSSHTPDAKQTADGDKVRQGTKKRRTVESSPEESRTNAAKVLSPATSRNTAVTNEMHSVEAHDPTNATVVVSTEGQPSENDAPKRETVPPSEIQPSIEATNSDPVSKDEEVPPGVDRDAEHFMASPQSSLVGPSLHDADLDSKSSLNDTGGIENISQKVTGAADTDVTDQGASAKNEAERIARDEADKAALAEQIERAEQEKKAAELREVAAAEELRKQAEMEARKQAELEALARRKKEEEEAETMRLMLELRRRQQEDEENERRRVAALPVMLAACARMLDDNNPTVRSPQWLEQKFLPLYTVKTSQFDVQHVEPDNDVEWVPCFQIAGLLATKDIALHSYPSLQKRPVSQHEQSCMWRVARIHLSYEYFTNPFNTSFEEGRKRERSESAKFLAMEGLSWVKLANFKALVPEYPHLASIQLSTRPISLKSYTELSPDPPKQSPAPVMPLTNGIHVNGALSEHD